MSSFVAVGLMAVLSIMLASWRRVRVFMWGFTVLVDVIIAFVGFVAKVYRWRVLSFVFRQNR